MENLARRDPHLLMAHAFFGNAASRMQGIVAGFGWEEATIGSILGVIFAAGGQRRQTLGFAA